MTVVDDGSVGRRSTATRRGRLGVLAVAALVGLVGCGPAASPERGAGPTSIPPPVTVVEVQATVPAPTTTTTVVPETTTTPPTTSAPATTAAPATTRAPVTTIAAAAAPTSCPNGTYVNTAGNVVCRPAASPTGPPAGATAQCRDGDYSYSQSRSGTCSGHGGVARWL